MGNSGGCGKCLSHLRAHKVLNWLLGYSCCSALAVSMVSSSEVSELIQQLAGDGARGSASLLEPLVCLCCFGCASSGISSLSWQKMKAERVLLCQFSELSQPLFSEPGLAITSESLASLCKVKPDLLLLFFNGSGASSDPRYSGFKYL